MFEQPGPLITQSRCFPYPDLLCCCTFCRCWNEYSRHISFIPSVSLHKGHSQCSGNAKQWIVLEPCGSCLGYVLKPSVLQNADGSMFPETAWPRKILCYYRFSLVKTSLTLAAHCVIIAKKKKNWKDVKHHIKYYTIKPNGQMVKPLMVNKSSRQFPLRYFGQM